MLLSPSPSSKWVAQHFFPLANLGLGELSERRRNQLNMQFGHVLWFLFRLSFATIQNDCHASLRCISTILNTESRK